MSLPPLVGVLLAMVVCTILGVTIERLAYRPLRQAAPLAVLITAIGVSYLLQNLAQLIWTANPKSFPSLITLGDITLYTSASGASLRLTGTTIVTVLANIVIMIALTLFTGHTKMGKAMRAAGGHRGRAFVLVVSGVAAHHRLHAGHQGFHRGGIRRYRLHSRGNDRRHPAGRD